jgi:RNA polymerase sigma factor (sigma-70 family)
MENVTRKVLEFQRTGAGLGELVREIAPVIYQFPRRRLGLDEDACGDFFLFFWPRLHRMLAKFQDQGRPFEAYLAAGMNWQIRNFARERRLADRKWNASLRLERQSRPGMERREGGEQEAPAAVPAPLLASLAAAVRTPSDRRNFLFLLLKRPDLAGEGCMPALARLAGIEPGRFAAVAAELSRRRAPRMARLEGFAERRNRAFSEGRLLEGELRAEPEVERRRELEAQLSRANRRMREAALRMSRVATAPTNREIAETLGVPKGTVDSGTFLFRKKLGALLGPDSLRAA